MSVYVNVSTKKCVTGKSYIHCIKPCFKTIPPIVCVQKALIDEQDLKL